MTHRLRLPWGFVARSLRFDEMPQNAVSDADAANCHPADYKRFAVVHNERALAILGQELGLTEPRIRQALALKKADPLLVSDAPWAQLLVELLSTAFLRACDRDLLGSHGLRKILYPFLNRAQAHIAALKARHRCDWDKLSDCLLLQFSDLLVDLALKTILLEANILRQLRPETEGRQTTEFGQNFAEYCASSVFYVQKFYLRYAALSRLLASVTLQWQHNLSELLNRLDADRDAVAAEIFGAEFGLLREVKGTLSDSHDGGKSVLFLEFDCRRRLVYKPRPLQIDEVFERLTDLVAQTGLEPNLRPLSLVARDHYGWVEIVPHRPITDLQEAHDFYFRQGINLALVQVLRGTDFHSENIIADGAQPVLIDLEALLHPRPRREADSAPSAPAEEWLGCSVFVSGLLPGWSRAGEDQQPDLSGLGGGQEVEFYQRLGDTIQEDKNGALRVVQERIQVAERDNRLMYQGQPVRPLPYTEDIVAGFTATYNILLEHRASLAGPGTVPPDCLVRYIALDTATYGYVLKQSLHPDFMRRSVHRELVAASLAYRAPFVDWVRRLLQAEIDAIFKGDIPKFIAAAASNDIADHRGVVIADFLNKSPVAILQDKIASLSPSDRDRQAATIRLAMATLCKRGEPGSEPQPPVNFAPELLSQDEILVEVAEIGDRICAEAIIERGEPDWIILTHGENGRSGLSQAGTDIYDGAGGIGLFLYEAGHRLQSGKFLDMARACGKRLAGNMGQEKFRTGGAFSGAASSAHALFRLGQSLGEAAWRSAACEELVRLSAFNDSDQIFDLVAGSAGYVGVLLDVYRATGESALREPAIAAAELLLRKRVLCDVGIALPPRKGDRALTGLSHGAAGLGFALLQIGAEFGREDMLCAGFAAYDYENSLHDPAILGYPDFRAHLAQEKPADSGAWCHGAPGIVLSRIAMPPHLRREADQQTITRYWEGASRAPLAPGDCLCHGEIGNVELFVVSGQRDGNAGHAVLARQRISTAILRKRQTGSWRCGAIPRVFVPGAMIGEAGIGYGLIRAYDPVGLCSILLPC